MERRTENLGNGKYLAYMMGGYPVAWAVGLGPAIFVLLALPMLVELIKRRPISIPHGTILFALFLTFVAASAIQLKGPSEAAIYGLRTLWYVSAFIVLLYLAIQKAPSARVVVMRGLVWFWVATALLGFLGVIAPELSWSSPVQSVLPGFIGDNDYVKDLIQPRTSEVQVYRWQDVTLYRPSAPFTYTNGWGSGFSILSMFAAAAAHDKRVGFPKPVILVVFLIGLAPLYYSLNRGAWASLVLGLGLGLVRYSFVSKNFKPIKLLAVVGVACAVIALSTGVLNTASEQLETRAEGSNNARGLIYGETFKQSIESPFIGYAVPRENPVNPSGPPLGSHGQLWVIMYAHGFLAMIFYIMFFVQAVVRSTARDPISHWAKMALLLGVLQIPIYGQLPQQLFILIAAVGLSSFLPREDDYQPSHPRFDTSGQTTESVESEITELVAKDQETAAASLEPARAT